MRPMRPSKKRHSAASVFMLGIGIGITLSYAFFAVMETDFSKSAKTPVNEATPETPTPVETAAVPTPPPAPAPEVSPAAPAVPPPAPEAATPAPPEPAAPPTPPAPAETPMEDPADVEGLWPARHLFIGVEGTALSPETLQMIAHFKPGGVVLRAANITDEAQTRQLVITIKEAAGLGTRISQGPLIAIAQEGGDSDELNPLRLKKTPFVRALAEKSLAEKDSGKDSPKAIRDCAKQYAKAALSNGIGVILGPVLDVYKEGDAPKEWRNRTFADTPDGVVQLGIPFVQSLCGEGIIAVPKYYPGAAAAKHTDGKMVLGEKEFPNLAKLMYPFDAATQAQAPGLIAGRIAVPLLDSQHPDRPAMQSAILIRDLVRTQMTFSGVILGDDVSAETGLEADTPAKNTVLALAAGCDGVLLTQATPDTLASVCTAIIQATRPEPVASLRVDELLRSKERLQAWNQRLAQVDGRYPTSGPRPAEREGVTEKKATEKAEDEASTKAEEKAPVKADPEATPKPEAAAPKAEEKPKEAAPAESKKPEAPAPTPAKSGDAPAVTVLPTLPPAPPAAQAPAEAPKAETPPAAPAAPVETKEASNVTPNAAASPEPAEKEIAEPANTVRVRHTIQRGESLTTIAKEYGVRVTDLQAWNNLKDNDIRFGRRLRIYVPEDSAAAKKAKTTGSSRSKDR